MIELIVGRFVKAVETLAHDDVTGRAGAVEFAGMLNLHAVGKQRPGKVGTGFSFKGLALGRTVIFGIYRFSGIRKNSIGNIRNRRAFHQTTRH